MTKTYIPQTGGVAYQVCRYFQRLEDEELSTADIALKWSIESGNVRNLLGKAIDAGYLKRDGQIYSAGPQLHTLCQAADGYSLASGALLGLNAGYTAYRTPKERISVTREALQALPVEEGVPVTSKGPSAGSSKWGPLFDRLPRPGLSIAVPLDWKKALGSEATKRNREARKAGQTATPWRVGNDATNPQHARLWRLA